MTFIKLYQSLKGLLRIPTFLLLTIYALLGVLIRSPVVDWTTQQMLVLALKFLVLVIAVGLWYMNGTSLNDYADYGIDQINLKNDPNRPLVTGFIDKIQLARIAIACSLLCLVCALILGYDIAILFGFLLTLNVAYSMPPLKLSHRGIVAPILLPLGYVSLPILGGILIADSVITAYVIYLIVGLYVLFMSRIILKDYRDVKGDAKFGKRTALLRYGSVRICQIAMGCCIAGTITVICIIGVREISTVIALCYLSSMGLLFLSQLAQAKSWPEQRPYITSYGRTQSGVLLILCLHFAMQVSHAPTQKQAIVQLAAVVLVSLSIRDIVIAQSPRQ